MGLSVLLHMYYFKVQEEALFPPPVPVSMCSVHISKRRDIFCCLIYVFCSHFQEKGYFLLSNLCVLFTFPGEGIFFVV